MIDMFISKIFLICSEPDSVMFNLATIRYIIVVRSMTYFTNYKIEMNMILIPKDIYTTYN